VLQPPPQAQASCQQAHAAAELGIAGQQDDLTDQEKGAQAQGAPREAGHGCFFLSVGFRSVGAFKWSDTPD
jgi:hypothetical protein